MATAAALSAGAIAYAAVPDSRDGNIYACYDDTHLVIKDLAQSTSCPSGQTLTAWAQTGRQGPTGSRGAVGPKGDTGPQGPPGPSGRNDQHFAVISPQSLTIKSDSDTVLYYWQTGRAFLGFASRDISKCAITATAEDSTGNGNARPTTTSVMRWSGYVLIETQQQASNGTFNFVDVPVDVAISC